MATRCCRSPGDKNFVVPGHRDIAYRGAGDRGRGIDMQVIYADCPGSTMEEPKQSAYFASLVNDSSREDQGGAVETIHVARDAAAQRSRRVGEGIRPRHVDGVCRRDGVREREQDRARRAVSGRCGSRERSRSGGSHSPELPTRRRGDAGVLAHAAGRVHVRHDAGSGGPRLRRRAEAFPRIRWVLGHLGGAIPYLAERLDRGFEAYPECRVNIDRPPE